MAYESSGLHKLYGSGVSSAYVTSGGPTDWVLISGVYDGAGAANADRVRMWHNGSPDALSFVGSIPSALPAGPALGIGAQFDGSSPLTGDVAEVIAYPTALSDAQRRQVEAYLAARYGLALPPTATPTPTITPTPHPGQFQDVPPSNTFYTYVECMGTRGIINGYPCGGVGEPCVPDTKPYFRPNNNLTRGQLAKIMSIAAHYTETPTTQTFEDVPPSHPLYVYIERIASRQIVGGYPCGGAFEPCMPPANRPYFRPNNYVTRGQVAKIIANAVFPGCQTPLRR
jgi:hypothetical protein